MLKAQLAAQSNGSAQLSLRTSGLDVVDRFADGLRGRRSTWSTGTTPRSWSSAGRDRK